MDGRVRCRIAVFSGPTATIQNSPPLITSNKARDQYGIPTRGDEGTPDALRPQRLAAPVVVYVEQFSAHPLERDAADLYAPPDGYVDEAGEFHEQRRSPTDTPVYRVTLEPSDGLYPLPYMGRQADGSAWEDDLVAPFAPPHQARQPFYPDGSRIFEEIDRLGVGEKGLAGALSAQADFDFIRSLPAGGYRQGLPEDQRTDLGDGPIDPEQLGADFFVYRPYHLSAFPTRLELARATNAVQETLASGNYDGSICLEGSSSIEESMYWYNLLIDTAAPIVGCASMRYHGSIGNDGDRNLVDAVDYIGSRVWADDAGNDTVGAVVIDNRNVITAREVQKTDARPGGYAATGGLGGPVASIGDPDHVDIRLGYRPTSRHTWSSELRVTQLPDSVTGVQRGPSGLAAVEVRVIESGRLLETAIPEVRIVKESFYMSDRVNFDADLRFLIDELLQGPGLCGIVAEGLAPYGHMGRPERERTLQVALFSGIPVLKVGRGNNDGTTAGLQGFLGGNNLTSTKARLLLMACLMKLGTLPIAADPTSPTPDDRRATGEAVREYQRLIDAH